MNPNVAAAKSALTNFQGSQKSSNDILNAAMTQYGVQNAQNTQNGLQTTLNNTTAALNALPAQVQGRTSRSLVTQAQLAGITNEEAAPIQQALASQQAEYNTASDNYKTLLGEAQNSASAQITDQQNKEAQLEQNYQDASNQAAANLAAQQWQQQFQAQQKQNSIDNAQKQQELNSAASSAKTSNPINSIGQIQGGLMSVRGKDGYVSPQDYAKAYADWVQVGGSKTSFDQMFGHLKNPSNKYYGYAISQLGI